MKLPSAIHNLIDAFERLPGIGSKTAARLTFYLLHVPEAERQRFGQALLELGERIAICERCFNITDRPAEASAGRSAGSEGVLCDICSDPNRDQSVICVVEESLDLMAFERTGRYNGLYHVLQGVIAPLEHIGPEDLKIDELIARLRQEAGSQRQDPAEENPSGLGPSTRRVEESAGEVGLIKEVILATNPSLEGEATAMYIRQLIGKQLTANGKNIKITRIARGIPTGGDLEYADEVTLTKALEGRQDY